MKLRTLQQSTGWQSTRPQVISLELVRAGSVGQAGQPMGRWVVWALGRLSFTRKSVTDHASRVPVVAETYDYNPIFLRQNGLVNLPAVMKVLQHIRHRSLLYSIFRNMKQRY